MTTKHTPGKWRATFRGIDQDADWSSRIPYAIERVVGGSVLPIADICDQPQAKSNAQLIAAAPELLAALQSMIKLIDDNGLCPDDCEEYDKAIAAIAKATGGAA